MPYDWLMMAAVARELREKIIPGRVERVYQPETEEVILKIYAGRQNYRLLLSAHPQLARVHLTRMEKENPRVPPPFCLVLRRRLEGARLSHLEQPALERVLVFHLAARDETGRTVSYRLVAEVMGKHSNIILLNPEGRVVDAIKRIGGEVSRYREVLPGREYLPPPPPDKANPLSLNREAFALLLGDTPRQDTSTPSIPLSGFTGPPGYNIRLADLLLEKVGGLSPLLAREIAARGVGNPNAIINEITLETAGRLWEALDQVLRAPQGSLEPTLILGEDGQPRDVTAIRLAQFPGERQVSYPSPSELLDSFYSRRQGEHKLAAARSSLLRTVSASLERSRKKLALQQAELDEARRAEDLRLKGELILAHLHDIPPGSRVARLANYHREGSPVLEVELDPYLTPAENAQRYFREYHRARSALQALWPQVEKTEEEIRYLEQVEASLEQAEGIGELEEIRQELVEQGYLKEKQKGARQKKGKPGDEPRPLRFLSSEELEILVGRNNRQNDHLTLGVASPQDVWLHTRDIPGAHVILRLANREGAPPRSLEEAALLAAYFSKGRHSSKVPVDYTLRSHVCKPRGSRPGMVVYDHHQTLYVTPAGPVLDRLLAQQQNKGH